MATKIEIISKAKPHTIKKFELISRYVETWSRKILENNKSQGIVFIDCMSNSGFYYDINNNLVEGTAILVTRLIDRIMLEYPNKKAWLYFNDISKERIEYLEGEIIKFGLSNVNIRYSNDDCDTFLKAFDLKKHRNVNTLLVYDPYEASIDWDALSPFLNTWGEVLINHMISDTVRGAVKASKKSAIVKYQNTYHKTIAEILSLDGDRKKLEEIIIDLIREQTANSTREHFIASFPFYNRNNGQVYNLIFCSSNIAGIILFKKTAWKTFGGKSSLKDTHGNEDQLCLDFDGNGISTITDESCFYVHDIAKYIYDKYHGRGVIDLNEIYYDLDRHPIFPSDGYKTEIKNVLKERYGVLIQGRSPQTIVFK